MRSNFTRLRYVAPILFAAACSSALADQPQSPAPPPGYQAQIALAGAPVKVRAPYDVQVLRENGQTLPTYGAKDRYYVQGNAGERYVIRVSNPTAHRIEAVVSVDGVDVIDGEDGDLHKRGYVIPPHGETRIEGFRTSQADVATFRFSSVDGSYAGMKGKPRNVGVIAVALFEEQHVEEQVDQGQMGRARGVAQNTTTGATTTPTTSRPRRARAARTTTAAVRSCRRRPRRRRRLGRRARRRRARAPAASAPGNAPPLLFADYGAPSGDAVGRAPAPEPAQYRKRDREYDGDDNGVANDAPAKSTIRPGLGTEFGEARYSAASYTQFVRSTTRPVAIAELRYNDAAGLMALGIPLQPMPDEGEIMTRETADPFPGDDRFAHPPR